jgi:histidinol dehydrogenase
MLNCYTLLQTTVGQPLNRCLNYGGLFIGTRAAEVLGDYGAGPNHVLPTGGTARYTGGLSVFNFVRVRTWMRIDDAAASQQVCGCFAISLPQLQLIPTMMWC